MQAGMQAGRTSAGRQGNVPHLVETRVEQCAALLEVLHVRGLAQHGYFVRGDGGHAPHVEVAHRGHYLEELFRRFV